MRIAVTGATGFVGAHALAALAAGPDEIVAALRPTAQLPERFAGRVEIAAIDLRDPPADAFARLGAPDALLHLAWGGLPNYLSLHHFETEAPAHYRFLAGLARSGLRRIVAVGTCFEYGMQSGCLSESAPARPANPYGLAKDMLRRQLEYLRARTPFELVWARLFYMHGEGQAANSLIPQLQAALARGDTRFAMSGGEQLRDYLPVEDVARHLVALTRASGDVGVVNVCSGRPTSVRRLVEEWLRAHGATMTLDLGRYPYPDYEPMAFWGDDAYLTRCVAT